MALLCTGPGVLEVCFVCMWKYRLQVQDLLWTQNSRTIKIKLGVQYVVPVVFVLLFGQHVPATD